jgi:hypothetical protein
MGEERYYTDIGKCPCGKGKIVNVYHSPDNAWSRPYETKELSCHDCDKSWDLGFGGNELVDRASRDVSRAADKAHVEATNVLVKYLNSLLPEVSLPTFRTQALEHEYLTKAGLYDGRVGQYRYERRDKTMKEIATVRVDSPIVPKLVAKAGNEDTYRGLLEDMESARANATAKRAAINVFKF